MAAPGKKNKTKWTPVPVEATTKRKAVQNWADEVDKEIVNDSFLSFKTENVILPTAPRASRATNIDESKIPTIPPFQVYLSNIPYDLTDEELVNYFRDLKIKSVHLPREDKGGGIRAKGFGYMELEDRNSMIAILSKPDTVIKGRTVGIELTTNEGSRGGMNRGNRGNRDGGGGGRSDMGGGSDRTSSNWRSGPRSDDFQDRSSNYDRGYGGGGGGRREFTSGGGGGSYGRGGFDREENRGGGSSFHREEGSSRGFDRERFGGDRRDTFYDRDRTYNREDRNFGGDRDRGFSRGREDREERGGSNNNSQWREDSRSFRFDDRSRGGERDRESRFNSRRGDDFPQVDRASAPSANASLKTRPVLKLLPPKSTTTNPPAEENGPAPMSASIFGGAKPVDTAAREREIEDRLMRSSDVSSEKRSRPVPAASSSGGGQPPSPPQNKEAEVVVDGGKKWGEQPLPPKENPWSKNKTPASEVINNGRTTPDEVKNTSTTGTHLDRDKAESIKAWVRSQRTDPQPSTMNEESKWGKASQSRPPPLSSNVNAEKPRAKEEKPIAKHRETKRESIDDYSKMPKVQESAVPNFAGSNKFSTLVDSDEAPTE